MDILTKNFSPYWKLQTPKEKNILSRFAIFLTNMIWAVKCYGQFINDQYVICTYINMPLLMMAS